MKSSINYLLPLLLAAHPASAAEPDPPASAEVARLRAEVSQLRAEIQALRARSRQPEPTPATREPARMAADNALRTMPLPTTQLFTPLRADPKEPRVFVSALQVDSAPRDTTLGAVGFGEHFGLVRRETANGEGWQLGIAGAVFAQVIGYALAPTLVRVDVQPPIVLT